MVQAVESIPGSDLHELIGPVQIFGQFCQVQAVKMAQVEGTGYGRVRAQVADAHGDRRGLLGGGGRRSQGTHRPVGVMQQEGGENQSYRQEGHQEEFVCHGESAPKIVEVITMNTICQR